MRPPRIRSAGLLLAFVAEALLAAGPVRADTVTDWNVVATDALVTPTGMPQAPTVQTIHLAMVHGAVFDAVNSIDRGYKPYLVRVPARSWYSKDAAAAAAAYRVLTNIVPAQQTTLDARYAASLAPIPDGSAKQGGIAVGEAAAWAMIAARTEDGRFGPYRFPVGEAPGSWRPVLPAFVNDPNAWVKDVEPFLGKDPEQFRSHGPYDLGSRRYAREFEEVKLLGSQTSKERSDDQTDAARFWAEGSMIVTRLSRDLAAGFGLGVADSARMYAMEYLTGADALIAVWDDKARSLFWRPITAIREAASDGNAATKAQADWLPLINNPPYPDHPSGLAGVTRAMFESLGDFFRTDRIAFTATSLNSGTSRSFARFSQAADEVVDARVWAGIHFRKADEDGSRIGEQVAHWRDRHFFENKH
jgi:hypothetical protein